MKIPCLTLSALLAMSCAVAIAAPTSDEALERMRSMKTTGQSLDMKTIPRMDPPPTPSATTSSASSCRRVFALISTP